MPRASRFAPWLIGVALVTLLGLRFSAVLASAETDFLDFDALHGHRLVFERPDTRLNSWILAWVDRTALRAPADLYHPNIHHPERLVLTGSEHLFGVALQLLPFDPWLDNAVARHQIALVLSSALLVATSFAAIRWATGSSWAAALGAAFALGMPWRVTEASHLQLVSAQWLPLVWFGVVRGLLGDTRPRSLAMLGVAVALQLLSSFYLAYFMTLSCAVLVAVVASLRAPRLRDVLKLAAAAAPGYALFIASALPYLARRADAQLAAQYDPSLSIPLGSVLAMLAPRWPWAFELLNEPANYWTPWAVLLLALIAIASATRLERGSRLQLCTASLFGIVVLSLVMMLGGSLELAGVRLPTPARLLAEIVPGFSLLRGPTRWGILAASALPLLAGLGAHALDVAAGSKVWARAGLTLLSATTFAWFALPTAPVWPYPDVVDERYAALRALPPGPLLELPWSPDAGNIEEGSRSTLASTLHWRPTLNGYTGHGPRSYRLLQRVAQQLPTKQTLDQLRRLTGVRFVLLDLQHLPGREAARWARAEALGWVRSAHTAPHTRIYELTPAERTGDLIHRLIDPTPHSRTFNGLSREPLELPEDSSEIWLETSRRHEHVRLNPAELRIRNASQQVWPGFDIDPSGLVQLRYSYFPRNESGEVDYSAARETRIARLDLDIEPGPTTSARVLLEAPRRGGSYELCADLIQQLAGGVRTLPIRAVRRNVEVRGSEDETELSRLLNSAFIRPEPPPPCGSGSDPD